MSDVHTPEQRRRNMAAIRSKDTRPEKLVRKLIHGWGFRFRLHRKDLPGKPDIVLPKFQKVIFVNGCFWHMHNCRYGRVVPKTNSKFWQDKRLLNVKRDKKNKRLLRSMRWKYLIVWECQTRKMEKLEGLLLNFLADS